jgi:hypothetical protein
VLKRLIMIGLLGISVVALFAAKASAQIGGWGWFGFSSIHGDIDTIHTPPPQTHPSQLQATVTGHFQIACFNPANNGISNGKAFTTTASGFTPIGQANITDRKGGKAKTTLKLLLDQLEIPANCTNPHWIPIPDSAIAFDFSGTVLWCLTDTTTGLPDCSSKKGLLDSQFVSCTLDTTLSQNQRDPDTGTAPPGAVFSCNLPQ